MKVLIVEDQKNIADLMTLHLQREGFLVDAVDNGELARKKLQDHEFDLAIIDWMLPGVSGLDLCKEFHGKLPILMVTAKTSTSDIVLGLEMGADDYITKPFEIPIFIARVRSLLRRKTSKETPQNIIQIGVLEIDLDRFEAKCQGQQLSLTISEFRLLAALMTKSGTLMKRKELVDIIQGEGVIVTDRTIDIHVFGLRKKLGSFDNCIETVRGLGYRIKI